MEVIIVSLIADFPGHVSAKQAQIITHLPKCLAFYGLFLLIALYIFSEAVVKQRLWFAQMQFCNLTCVVIMILKRIDFFLVTPGIWSCPCLNIEISILLPPENTCLFNKFLFRS